MGAGILPVCLIKGNVFFLMGQERSTKEWSDFGGRTNKNESIYQTAIREGSEELNGLLGVPKDIGKLIKHNLVKQVHHDIYTTFIINMPYIYNDAFLNTFDNVNRFAEKHLQECIKIPDNGLYEKVKIKWFSIDDLKSDLKRKKSRFRPFYKNILYLLLESETDIKKNISLQLPLSLSL